MPTESQIAEISRMKAYFPYRIAYGALNEATGEFIAAAASTKRPINKLAREGWKVWMI